MSKQPPRAVRVKRLVSCRWLDCTKTYQRLEVGDTNCPHDAAIRKIGARWEVWVGEGGNPKRECIGSYTRRTQAEQAAILNVEHLLRKTANASLTHAPKGGTK